MIEEDQLENMKPSNNLEWPRSIPQFQEAASEKSKNLEIAQQQKEKGSALTRR